MDWLQEYEFSTKEIKTVIAGMKEMSAVDGDEDPQEVELIEQVAEGIEGPFSVDLQVFETLESKKSFLYLVTFVALIDTTINDAEWNLLTTYVATLNLDEDVQYFIDVVGESFLKTVFADSDTLQIWVPRLKDALRLSPAVVDRLLLA
jgi:hypothetical protein